MLEFCERCQNFIAQSSVIAVQSLSKATDNIVLVFDEMGFKFQNILNEAHDIFWILTPVQDTA